MIKTAFAALVLSAGVLLSSTAARAADPIDPTYDWTGFYAGLQAGYGWSGADWTNTVSNSAFTDYAIGTSDGHDMDGLVGGAQFGYNWQNQSLVLGAELSLLGSGIDGSSNSTVGVRDDTISTSVDFLAMASLRAGLAIDNFLPYVRAGYAGGSVDMNLSDTVGTAGTWQSDEWHHGFLVGVGAEYGVSSNLTLGIEYNYVHLQDKNHSATGSTALVDAYDVDIDDMHLVTARLNWRF
jgi:outer membrane immunogenic protein